MTPLLSDFETCPTAESDGLSPERQRLIEDLAQLVLYAHRHRLRQRTDRRDDGPADPSATPPDVTAHSPDGTAPGAT